MIGLSQPLLFWATLGVERVSNPGTAGEQGVKVEPWGRWRAGGWAAQRREEARTRISSLARRRHTMLSTEQMINGVKA